MGARAIAASLAGLAAALATSFAIWRTATGLAPDLRFVACLAPLVAWGLLPLVLSRTGRHKAGSQAGRDRKKAVLSLLAKHGLAGRRARYRVPLFLVVGPDGAGKSSLIQACGLGPESGVRIADAVWWIGREAILVEATVGAAHEDVVRLAALLQAVRPALPLNAVLLVVSPADLALTDAIEQNALAQATAEALAEIEASTHRRYPLYMMLSKIDLVPGFREFFDRQEPQERARLWGFSLPFRGLAEPPGAKETGEALTRGFRAILAATRARLVEWLSREGDPIRCGRINGFAAQVATLLPAIQPMLDALTPERGRAGAPLRGILLTSTRQEGLSIDPLLPELSGRLAMPRSGLAAPDLGIDDEHHDFFVAGAFRDAVLPEAGLALRQRPWRGHMLAGWAAAACAVAAALVLGAFLYDAFERETARTARVEAALAGLQPLATQAGAEQLSAVLGQLQQIGAQARALDEAAPAAGRSALAPERMPGLTADGALKAHLARTREALLRNALAPHLAALLESRLADPEADPGTLEALIRLADPAEAADPPGFHAWLEATAPALPEALRATFVEDGAAAFAAVGRIAVGPAYLDAARRIIAYKESRS